MNDVVEQTNDLDDADFNASLSSVEDTVSETPEGEVKPDDGIDFLKDAGEKKEEPKAEEAKEEVKEEDYTWSPPEEMRGLWESAGEEGQKEFQDFQQYAKEKGIKGEVFKELMDKYVKNVPNPAKVEESLAKQWGETLSNWHKEILADKEVGGQQYKQSKENAILAVKELGGKDLATELQTTGFGNNPKLFKFLAKVGDMMREGNFVKGGVPKERTPLYSKLYK